MNTVRNRGIALGVGTMIAAGSILAGTGQAIAAPSSPAKSVSSAKAKSAHVALTVLVTGRGRHAHLVMHERGVAVGGASGLASYEIDMDGKAVTGGDAGASPCPKKPLQSFQRAELPAPIHLVKGRHVIKLSALFCNKPGTNSFGHTTHTVSFTAR